MRLIPSSGPQRVPLFAAAALTLLGTAAVAAPAGPFGVAPPEAMICAPDGTGFFGWILALQSHFNGALRAAVRALRTDGTAVWALAGVSFLYGVFHAAGPGHGKAVITAYLFANEQTLRRGVLLSFASAIVQATSAVLLVGLLALVFRMTSLAMTRAERWLELASYALIMGFGAWLLAGKLGLRTRPEPRPVSVGAAAVHDSVHGSGGHHHHAGHDGHACCGHAHAPDPRDFAGRSRFGALSAVFAVGLRPCTGAVIILVFALSQGFFWAGILSAYVMGVGTAVTVAALASLAVGAKGAALRMSEHIGYRAARLHRAIEIGGAAAVFLLGAALLAVSAGVLTANCS